MKTERGVKTDAEVTDEELRFESRSWGALWAGIVLPTFNTIALAFSLNTLFLSLSTLRSPLSIGSRPLTWILDLSLVYSVSTIGPSSSDPLLDHEYIRAEN